MKKLLFSFLAFAISAVPVLAFEIPMPEGMKLDLYGQARMTAAYEYSNASDTTTNLISSDFKMRWQSNSRFGINFSAGNFFANAEMNVIPDQLGEPIGFREFYGGYTFGNGLTLIAGNKSTLTGNGISSDVYFEDNGLVGFGTASDSRRPMLMVSFAGLSVAAVANGPDIANSAIVGSAGVAEEYIPRFEIAYDYESDFMTARVFGTYGLYTQHYLENNGRKRVNIHAWHAGFDVMPTFGSMYVGVSAFVGMNAGMYGAVYTLDSSGYDVVEIKPSIDAEGNVNDVLTWGVAAVVGMQINEMFSFEIGGGYQNSTADDFLSYKDGEEVGIAGYAAYIQTPITFAEGYFTLVPQVGYYARQTDYIFEGATSVNALIAGAQVVVKF